MEGKRGEERGSAVDHTASIFEPLKAINYRNTNTLTTTLFRHD